MKASLITLFTGLLLFAAPLSTEADMKSGDFINPITDVAWHEIFPIKIGGVEVYGSDNYDNSDPASDPVCYCMYEWFYNVTRFGVPMSMWEPARMIETVATPYYFPFIGTKYDFMGDGDTGGGAVPYGYLSGKNAEMDPASQEMSSFAQAHYWIFPVWAILGLFTDSQCVDGGNIDLAYMTELDSLWQDAQATAVIQPEAITFANRVAQLACIADSVAVNVWAPIDALFWCIGSSGSSYPLTGHVGNENLIQANAAIAARLLYKLHRQFLVCDHGVDLCYCMPMPIWRKSNYKLHAVRPAVRNTAYPIGKSQFFYGAGLNPANPAGKGSRGSVDEFLWMLFRKRACCAS